MKKNQTFMHEIFMILQRLCIKSGLNSRGLWACFCGGKVGRCALIQVDHSTDAAPLQEKGWASCSAPARLQTHVFIIFKILEVSNMDNLKQKFIYASKHIEDARHLIVAVQLPTGAIEIIHNTECLSDKAAYYRDKYDDEFRLCANTAIRIVNFMII